MRELQVLWSSLSCVQRLAKETELLSKAQGMLFMATRVLQSK
jgi:hypothetical protein